jgi:hypothetical protein
VARQRVGYGNGVDVLTGLNLDVHAGEVVGLVGRNGAVFAAPDRGGARAAGRWRRSRGAVRLRRGVRHVPGPRLPRIDSRRAGAWMLLGAYLVSPLVAAGMSFGAALALATVAGILASTVASDVSSDVAAGLDL